MTQQHWTIRFKGYLPVDERMPDRLRRVMAEIDRLPDSALDIDEEAGIITVDYNQVRGWFEESRQRIGIVHVGQRVVVKPPWEAYEPKPEEIVLEIDPGTAFGSGLHESTALCIEELERRVRPGVSVIDFGTGSGILALCAAKLGAARVTPIDADHESSEIARENMRRNGVDSIIRVLFADSPSAAGHQAGLVTANVVPKTLIAKAADLFAALEPGGCLIASGMTLKQVYEVEEAFVQTGFEILDRPTKDRWAALSVTR